MNNSTPTSVCQNQPPIIDTSAPIMSNQAAPNAVNGLEAKIKATGVASSFPGFSVGVIYDQNLLFAAGFGCANIEQTIAAGGRHLLPNDPRRRGVIPMTGATLKFVRSAGCSLLSFCLPR